MVARRDGNGDGLAASRPVRRARLDVVAAIGDEKLTFVKELRGRRVSLGNRALPRLPDPHPTRRRRPQRGIHP